MVSIAASPAAPTVSVWHDARCAFDGAHRLCGGIERAATRSVAACVVKRKDREHAVADELEHLPAARSQRCGQRLENLVEQRNNFGAWYAIGDRREAADVGIPQHRAYPFYGAALNRAGVHAPSHIFAEIGGEQASSNPVARIRRDR